MSIASDWGSIRRWLDGHAPQVAAMLHGPADEAAFATLEATFGRALPDEFKQLYRLHDGADDLCGVLIGLSLMPLARIGHVWEMWADIADDAALVEELSEDRSSEPPGAVQPRYAHRDWLPFAGDSQNMVAIDYAPGPGGTVGQIINCGRDDEIRYLVAPSFGEFVAFLARQFAAGRVAVREDDPTWLRIAGDEDDLLTGLGPLLAADRADTGSAEG